MRIIFLAAILSLSASGTSFAGKTKECSRVPEMKDWDRAEVVDIGKNACEAFGKQNCAEEAEKFADDLYKQIQACEKIRGNS